MALDYSKLSDDELEAIANDDYSKLSDATLQAIANEPAAKTQAPAPEPGGAAPQFYPTGAGANVGEAYQTAKTLATPAVQGATNLAKTYATRPGALIADLAMSHMGLPPPVMTENAYKGINETYKTARDWINQKGQFTPKVAPGAEMANAAKISQAIGPEGLAAAMKPGATIPSAAPVAGGAPAAEGASFIERMAAKFAPMARAVAPVLNTVGRVAGPAGLAYNAYEGAQFAQQAELGPRLAQGQGAAAQGAFRNMNTQYGAAVSRDQARAVLQSGNERDIEAFGGRDRLMQLAQ